MKSLAALTLPLGITNPFQDAISRPRDIKRTSTGIFLNDSDRHVVVEIVLYAATGRSKQSTRAIFAVDDFDSHQSGEVSFRSLSHIDDSGRRRGFASRWFDFFLLRRGSLLTQLDLDRIGQPLGGFDQLLGINFGRLVVLVNPIDRLA